MGTPVVHFEIGCRDKDQSRVSTSRSLAGRRSRTALPHSGSIPVLQKGFRGSRRRLGHEPHHYVMLYMEVENIPDYLTKIESCGGKVIVPETAVPGRGHFAWCQDPQGNLFRVVASGHIAMASWNG